MPPGRKLPSVKREDGDIMVSRTIRTPSGSVELTGTLTEVDRIYRLLAKSLLQSGYKLTHLTKTVVPPGDPLISLNDELVIAQEAVDKLVDQSMEIIAECNDLKAQLEVKDREIARLRTALEVLEQVLSRVTSE
jgi:hypothetical protein